MSPIIKNFMNNSSHAVLFSIAIIATILCILTLFYAFIKTDSRSSYCMFVQVLSTVVLVVITIFYAVSTYRIADVTTKTFEATNRPYIYISKDGLKREGTGFTLRLENSGRIPGVLEGISGNANQIPLESKGGLVIFPDTNQEAHFEFNLDNAQSVEITIHYRSLNTDGKYYTKYTMISSKEMGIKALEIVTCEAK